MRPITTVKNQAIFRPWSGTPYVESSLSLRYLFAPNTFLICVLEGNDDIVKMHCGLQFDEKDAVDDNSGMDGGETAFFIDG